MTISQEEANEIIKKHQQWLDKKEDGKRLYSENIDLGFLDLSGTNLQDAGLYKATLRDTYLRETNLKGANLYKADLEDARLVLANLEDADLTHANLESADLCSANLKYANLRDSYLLLADLEGANLQWANLCCANLIGSCLTGANLEKVNLHNTIGDAKRIKTIYIEKYVINYTKDRLQIGCKNYSYEEWQTFTDDEIEKMDAGALRWWRKWKEWLFKTIEMSPAQE